MNTDARRAIDIFIRTHPEQVDHIRVVLEAVKRLNIEVGEIDVGQ